MNFSVVIPLYNKQETILNTVDSVLKQSHKNFELLIVDDGSTDDSLRQIKNINDQRIRIFQKENGGVSSARNFGILKSRFDFVAFLDADDLWLENHLETLNEMVLKYEDYSIFASSYILTEEVIDFKQNNNQDFIRGNYFKLYLNNDRIISSSCVAIRKNCFSKAGFFDTSLKRGEDLEMWARLARYYDMVKCSTITSVYNIGAENRNMHQSFPFSECYASKINLDNARDYYEQLFLKKQIRNKIKSCVYNLEFMCLFRVIYQFNFRII